MKNIMACFVFNENQKTFCRKEHFCSDSSIFGRLYLRENNFLFN